MVFTKKSHIKITLKQNSVRNHVHLLFKYEKMMFTFAIMLISQMGLALLVDAGFNVRCLDRVQTAPLHQATANEAQSWQKLGALGAHQGNVSKCV